MSIDLAQTPTLQAVATADEHSLIADLEQRVAAAAAQAAAQPEVIAAEENERSAAQRLSQLARAERSLTGQAKEIAERIASVRESALDILIESAAGGAKLDFKREIARTGGARTCRKASGTFARSRERRSCSSRRYVKRGVRRAGRAGRGTSQAGRCDCRERGQAGEDVRTSALVHPWNDARKREDHEVEI